MHPNDHDNATEPPSDASSAPTTRPTPAIMPRTTSTSKPQPSAPENASSQSSRATGWRDHTNQTASGTSHQDRASGSNHMWDGDGPDEFPTIDGIKPPFKRSDIERPRPEVINIIAYQHTGRRAHDHNKTPFPGHWAEADVEAWIHGIIKYPTSYGAAERHPKFAPRRTDGLALQGQYDGVFGQVIVRVTGPTWQIPTAYPLTRLVY